MTRSWSMKDIQFTTLFMQWIRCYAESVLITKVGRLGYLSRSVIDKVVWMFSIIFSTVEKWNVLHKHLLVYSLELFHLFSLSFWSRRYWYLCTSASCRNVWRPDMFFITKLFSQFVCSFLRIIPFSVKLHFCSNFYRYLYICDQFVNCDQYVEICMSNSPLLCVAWSWWIWIHVMCFCFFCYVTFFCHVWVLVMSPIYLVIGLLSHVVHLLCVSP